MNGWLAAMILAGALTANGFAAGNGPEVLNVDQQISINADGITLGRLLRLWDHATGMQSSIPSELADLTLSVHFTGLSMSDAVQKIFAGLPVDFVVVAGQGIVVTAQSQNALRDEQPPFANEQLPFDEYPPGGVEQPLLMQGPQLVLAPRQQDPTLTPTPWGPVIPTPFGPMVAPSIEQAPFVQLPPVPGSPPQVPFFRPEVPFVPPVQAPNGPATNSLFGPLPVYQDTVPRWLR